MPPDEPSLFSRDELLGGLPARRASTILFAIEARTAHLVARSKRAMAWYETPRTSAERERAFLEAIAGGRELPMTPTVQDLERFAPRWAELVPAGTDLRASLARLIAQKYRLVHSRVPRLRVALGLDDPEVGEAFERLHHQQIDSIYAARIPARERLRWTKADLARSIEELPPFWAAFALALTETIGEGILVIPIALAGLGPIPGIVLLVVLGVINILTMGGLAEAITRNGEMRYGTAYFGRLASALLGRGGSFGITVTLFAFNVVVFLAYMLAFAAPLADASGIPVAIWVAILFAINIFYLRRDIDSTVASAIVIGAINIVLIIAISLIALANVDLENLTYSGVPFLGGEAADVVVLGLAFGVTLVAYLGHTSAGNVAKIILAREPTGKALFWGNVAAVITVITLYCLAVLGINGAVPPQDLIGYEGTAIEPLAAQVGGSVLVLGSVYVTLAIGLGSIYVSLGLFNQVREWLPRRPRSDSAGGWSAFASSQRGGFLISLTPVVVVFLVLEGLVLADAASIAEPLSLIGVLTVPMLGGVFPMLMLLAARRRGEYVPGSGVKVLRGPVTIGLVAAVYFAGLLVQGLVIWQRPGERAAAVAIAIFMAAVAVSSVRRGAYRPRAVVELRRGTLGEGVVNVTVAGGARAIAVDVTMRQGSAVIQGDGGWVERFSDIRGASLLLPPERSTELKVWIHGVTPDAESQPIAGTVRFRPADATETDTVRSDDGVLIVPLDGRPISVGIEPEVTIT
jgi:amino acid permease